MRSQSSISTKLMGRKWASQRLSHETPEWMESTRCARRWRDFWDSDSGQAGRRGAAGAARDWGYPCCTSKWRYAKTAKVACLSAVAQVGFDRMPSLEIIDRRPQAASAGTSPENGRSELGFVRGDLVLAERPTSEVPTRSGACASRTGASRRAFALHSGVAAALAAARSRVWAAVARAHLAREGRAAFRGLRPHAARRAHKENQVCRRPSPSAQQG